MRDVLFLSYFFPPMGGGAVLRAVKFVKYLPAFGWRPLVVAGAARYHVHDEGLLGEIPDEALVRRVRPGRGRGRGRGDASVPAPGSPSVLSRASRRLGRNVRRLFSFPDLYAGFARPAYAAARAFLAAHGVKLVFSTAPPYTSHVVAARLAREAGVPLVLDYRDAWAGNPFERPPTPIHRWRTPRLEADVLAAAAAVVCVTAGMAREYRRRVRPACPVAFIPNGFDEEDFAGPARAAPVDAPFTVTYTGQFYGGRMPWTFLRAAARFVAARRLGDGDFLVRFLGPMGRRLLARAKAFGVPLDAAGAKGHREAVAAACAADVNLLVIGSRAGATATLTGKIFEYLRAARPILALVPPAGEAAALIRRFDAGKVVAPDDVAAAAAALGELYDGRHERRAAAAGPEGLGRFERRRLTAELAALLGDVVGS